MADPIAADRPLRWGILGAGGIAAKVGADIARTPGCTVTAVGARALERASALAASLGAPRAYGSYAELVADPGVDVIYVATTHAQHLEHAQLALRAGKPVLVEKAFALNARQGREIARTAQQQGLFCMEAMWMRLDPLVTAALELAQAGAIGTVRSVRAELSRLFPYDPTHRLYDLAVGGGGLLDLGVYPATFAWLFLGQPDTVAATGALSPTGSDSTAATLWGYADGRFATVSCSTELRTEVPAVIAGTEGWMVLDGAVHHPDALHVYGAHPRHIEAQPHAGNGFQGEIAEVRRCLLEGLTESPVLPLAQTIGVLELMDGVRDLLGVHYPADSAGRSSVDQEG